MKHTVMDSGNHTRRQTLTWALLGGVAGSQGWAKTPRRRPKLLVRSCWQTVSMGDVADTPGLLTLLERHLPKAEITLWPSRLDNSVRAMLTREFPHVRIVEGTVGNDGQPDQPELQKAWERCDFLLHGSGPSVVAEAHLRGWLEHTGKPFGVFGVTISALDDKLKSLLDQAAFVCLRDGVSLALVRKAGLRTPVVEFTPDSTFACGLRDDAAASAWMKAKGLEPGKFICAIPRLRHPPYFKIHNRPPKGAEAALDAESQRCQEPDHRKLREALISFLRHSKLKLAACPEMIHEVALAKEMLVDPMPEELKSSVIWRESLWEPGEAISVFSQACAVVSFELSSAILAAAAGTPTIHLRQPSDTSKGQAWTDIGLQNWLFEIEDTTAEQIATRLGEIYENLPAARQKLRRAMDYAATRQGETLALVAKRMNESTAE